MCVDPVLNFYFQALCLRVFFTCEPVQVDGRWTRETDGSSESDDIDFDEFGDDSELQKWGETDAFFPELPKEFDAGEENVRCCLQ